jgi:hypothetical protein
MLRYQYSASSSPVSRKPPVTVERNGTPPLRGSIPSSIASSCSRSPSACGECVATVAGTSRARTPSSCSAASSCCSDSRSPATAVERGPLQADTVIRSPHGARRSRSSPSLSATDTIPPLPTSSHSNLLRNAISRAASASERPPATHAAAISPWECPITTAGSTPHARHSAASETLTANSTGCTTSIRSSPGAPSSPRRTSSSDQSTNGASASPHSRICSANAGADSSSSRAIPAHCEPCPANTNTGSHTPVPAAPSITLVPPATGSPSPIAAKPSSSGCRPSASTTARRSNTLRLANSAATSSTRSSSSPRTRSASACANVRSAPSSRAESATGATPSPNTGSPLASARAPLSVAVAASSVGVAEAGGSSTITCAFVPLIPNDETPARRGR